MKLCVNPFVWLVDLLGIYLLTVLLYDVVNVTIQIPFASLNVFIPTSKIVGAGIILLVLWLYIKKLNTRSILLTVIVSIMAFVGALLWTYDRSQAISDAIFWAFTILFLYKLSDERFLRNFTNAIHKRKTYIKWIVLLSDLILIICLCSGFGYNYAWGDNYFIGFAVSNHVMACGACLCLVFTLIILEDIRSIVWRIAAIIPASVAILQTGARTYVASLLVILFLFYIYYTGKLNIKIILIPLLTIAAIYLFFNTGMYEKFISPSATATEMNIDTFTNERFVFWAIDINAYRELNVFGKLFGAGFDYPYHINKTRFGLEIWAHNDFINTLVTSGIVGLILYCLPIWKLFRTLKKKTGLFMCAVVMMYYIFVATINGLFGYQQYVYSFVLLYVFFYYTQTSQLHKNRQ